jgi:hypothetical protein
MHGGFDTVHNRKLKRRGRRAVKGEPCPPERSFLYTASRADFHRCTDLYTASRADFYRCTDLFFTQPLALTSIAVPKCYIANGSCESIAKLSIKRQVAVTCVSDVTHSFIRVPQTGQSAGLYFVSCNQIPLEKFFAESLTSVNSK